MIAESGHYALVLALALALIQSIVPVLGARWRDAALMNVARSSALAQLLFALVSFAALVTLHVTSDFSVANVYENSHSLKPLIYKITGVWGNHEGSMLLWVSILALFGGMVAAFGNNLPLRLRALVLAVQAWIASAFYLFILLTSNPFLRIANPPIEGRDLNPVLQDIGLAVHPPMLYLGYVGFSISFSFAIAALIEGRIDAAWARWVRPWTLGRLDLPDARHRDGLVLGLLRARLGRLVVLGPRRERLADALACRHRAAALRAGDGEAQRAESLDHPALDPDLLAVAARHLPGALGRAHLGARFRQRSHARRVHPVDPLHLHRRQPDLVCRACVDTEAGRLVCADLARGRAGAEQPVPDHGLRHRLRRHALSIGAGGLDRRQDFGRRAVLQSDLSGRCSCR